MDNAPEGGKRITAHHCRVAKGVREIIILLPFLGECWLRTIPKPSLFLYVGKELWSFLSATYSQFRRICYPPAWSMRIYYPINYEEPTPTLPKGGSRVLLSFCLMSFCPSVSCLSVLLSHVFLSFCLKKSFCLILKNIKISLLVFSVTLRSITFATDKEHQLRLKK